MNTEIKLLCKFLGEDRVTNNIDIPKLGDSKYHYVYFVVLFY